VVHISRVPDPGSTVDKKHKTKTALDGQYWKLMKRIAENIRRVRDAKGLTQEDMLSLGIERRWFQRIESGTYSVSLPTLDRVSRAFKVDISEFFK
jgi:DNA-binding XRE family transcriptional regulator